MTIICLSFIALMGGSVGIMVEHKCARVREKNINWQLAQHLFVQFTAHFHQNNPNPFNRERENEKEYTFQHQSHIRSVEQFAKVQLIVFTILRCVCS